MAKVTDTLKRVIKFEGVSIINNRIEDESGDVINQIMEKLPKGISMFDLQVTAAIPTDVAE